MKPLIAFVLAALVGTSCQALQSDPFRSPPIEAEFRSDARHMYASLRRPSCKAPRGFDRRAKLEDEYQAIRSFEQQVRLTPAQAQLAIASADAAFQQANGEDCWGDYDLVWAGKHVAMTRDEVRGTLGRLRAMAPSLRPGAPGVGADSNHAPEFRHRVRQLVEFSRPQCPLTTTAENDQVMGPARAEIARFRQGLEGTAFADQFDIAQADVAYHLSISTVDCNAPSQIESKKISEDAVAIVRRQLAAIGKLIGRT